MEATLDRLLATMEPRLATTRFAVETLAPGVEPAASPEPFAVVAEEEGLTVIAPALDGDWARISLTVQSSPAAMGMSAMIATALAREGISANVVAGFHHDHIFVPWERRRDAMVALSELSEDHR